MIMKFRLASAFGLIFALSAVAAAQPKSVTDYFLAMPAGVYDTTIEGKTVKGKALTALRRSMIKTEDVRNGYLRLEGPWEGWAEIALFKMNAGGYLLAEANAGCGPACDGSVRFWTYSAGRWTEVTRSYPFNFSSADVMRAFRERGGKGDDLGENEEIPTYFLLPREGRTIKVACNMCDDSAEHFTLFEYEWNGTKFVKR